MNLKEFERRRRQLMRMMGEGSVAILPAAPVSRRNRDVEYPYRQDSDFYYLTGFAEADSIAVLAPGRENGEFVLFCRERDEDKERWDGSITGPERAVSEFAADDAFPISDADDILPGLLERSESVYYTMGVYPEFDHQLTDWLNTLRSRGQSGAHTPQEFVALDHFLHDMRLYKSRAEQSAMRRAAVVSVDAHRAAMRATRPGIFEYEIEAEIAHRFRSANAQHAYPPIVGSGPNSCVLHYTRNDRQVSDGDLVLIDAGCELDYYASDVSRTYPANGRFTPEQRAVYEIVLAAQLAAIEKVRSGNHWDEPHLAALREVTKGMKEIGLIKGSLKTLLRDRAAKRFFMHRTGHWLGMDVHDVGDYRVGTEWRLLEPGMVTTVEPGIYIAPARDVPKRWHNIGIRIEDDVVVTKAEPQVLSGKLEKDPDALEAIVGG